MSARARSRTSLNSQVRPGPKPIAQSSMQGSLNSSSVTEIACRELARSVQAVQIVEAREDLDEPLVEEMHKDLVVDKANNIHNNAYFKTTY